MKKIVFSISFLFVNLLLIAQPTNSNSPKALLASGDEEIEKGQYYNALAAYEKVYKETKDKDVAIKIAKTHFLLRDYNRSVNYYNRILARDKANKYFEEVPMFGKALKMNGQAEEASAEFAKYIATGTDPNLKAMCELELAGLTMMSEMKENVQLKMKNAGNRINTPESQASPSMDSEGTLYFGSVDYKDDDGKEEKSSKVFSKLMSSKYNAEKGWSKAEELEEAINRPGYHTANVSFSKDGNTMFYTRVVSDGGLMEESKIYCSTKTGSGWSPALEVEGVNGEYMARHPVEGELFGSKVLFFSANIPGGKGGFDLYYATKTGDYQYATPVALSTLNTAGDEITPYYTEGVLYFSSDGWPAIGGLDVFSSKWDGSNWSSPMNMGLPINSVVDDIYYKMDPAADKGFLVSNRADAESKSLKSKTCCDDIYFIEKRKLVIDLTNIMKDESGKPLKGTTAQLIEMSQGAEGGTESKTNSTGNKIQFVLDKDKSYKIIVTKDGYFPAEAQMITVGINSDTALSKEFILKMMPPESDVEIITMNEPIRLNNIYYNYDDDKILPDAEKDLSVLRDLMNQYPDMVIELGSHTDSRGDDNYNQKLSLRRANSAKRWLVNKGKIVGDRIQTKGYGETVILNNCTNGEDCTDDEHRLNRRTEFKIIAGPTTIEVKKEVLNKKAKPNKKG
ncbi:MAG TPA: OmpA family protein [Saprospiraceae bacterium]|nr:OmpA family protein [Saprospiraceae bacterium]